MTQPQVSRRLATLFAAALLGVLVVVGIALTSLGWVALTSYLVVVGVGVTAAVRRARALREPAGRTCTCCTSTVFDPVEVR
jgi:hypothetical protein